MPVFWIFKNKKYRRLLGPKSKKIFCICWQFDRSSQSTDRSPPNPHANTSHIGTWIFKCLNGYDSNCDATTKTNCNHTAVAKIRQAGLVVIDDQRHLAQWAHHAAVAAHESTSTAYTLLQQLYTKTLCKKSNLLCTSRGIRKAGYLFKQYYFPIVKI